METSRNAGVSEILGALLMVSLVITGMGMVAVIMFSTPPPQSIKVVSLSSSCCRCSATGPYAILIYHNGGDALKADEIQFFVDGVEKDPSYYYSDQMGSCDLIGNGNIWDSTNPNLFLKSGEYVKILSTNEPQIVKVTEARQSARGPYLNSNFSCGEC